MLENISMPEFMLKTEDGTELKASDLTADGKQDVYKRQIPNKNK